MNPVQIEFFARSADTQAASVACLEQLLRERRTWLTAAQLLAILGREGDDDTKRYIRHLAQLSEWIISGQKGYKHLENATAEEVNHFANWMESQAREMTRRAETVRRNAHRIVG